MNFFGVEESMEYAYPFGKISYFEARRLTKEKIRSMITAASLRDALRQLEDTRYKHFLPKEQSFEVIEEAFENALNEEFSEIAAIVENKDMVDVFRVKYDFVNLKTLLKARLLNENAKVVFNILGTISRELFIGFMSRPLEEVMKSIPGDYAKAVEDAIKEYENSKNPFLLDLVMDKHVFDVILGRMGKKQEFKFMRKLTEMEIDLINIAIMLKAKSRGIDKDIFEKAVIPGGKLPGEKIREFFGMERDDMLHVLADGRYSRVFKAYWELASADENFYLLDKLSKAYLMRLIKEKAHEDVLTPNFVFSYLLEKEAEAETILLILKLKAKGVLPKKMNELVGDINA